MTETQERETREPQLQCFGCLLTGDYEVFGLPVQCPQCGSYEVWSYKP
jgi:hypothetical protein